MTYRYAIIDCNINEASCMTIYNLFLTVGNTPNARMKTYEKLIVLTISRHTKFQESSLLQG